MMNTNIRWICTTPDHPWQQRKLQSIRADDALDLRLDGTRHQTWEGFGGCFNELGWIALSKLDATERQRILRDLFDPENGCKFNFCRLPIGANDYSETWYSHCEHDSDLEMERFSIERDRVHLIPFIIAAKSLRQDLRLFASPWSPPTWMKFPKSYNYGTLVWEPAILRAYALYFLKFVEAYRAAGIEIHQVHVQNEPNSDQKFPSCLWTGAKMRDFIRDYLGPLFELKKIDCQIWAGTIERADYNAWANTILSDPAARRFVSGISYQWAGKEAVQKTHASWPDVKLTQSENECGDGSNTWAYAGYIFDLMQHYITNGVSAYCYWNMVLEPTGRSTWGWLQNSMITIDPQTNAITYNPEYYVMRHLSNFVKPGAVRLGLAGRWSSNAIAFANPDGETILAVRNPFTHEKSCVLTIGSAKVAVGLPPESFNTFVLRG